MNVLKVKRGKRPKKRFQRKEFDFGWRLSQVIYAAGIVFALDTHTHPHVLWPRKVASEFKQTFRTLGKNLKLMPRCTMHHVEDSLNEGKGNVLMEEVAHGVYKDALPPSPTKRQLQRVFVQREFKPIRVI
jgi:hypothetical protein